MPSKAIHILGAVVVSAIGLFTLPATAVAQSFPGKPVRILIPYPPGGPVDAFGRGLAEKLGSIWGQSVLVDNRPGANEIIAAEATSKAAPDGYTYLLAADPTLSQNQFLYSKLPYDPEKDLLPVSQVVVVNMALIVNGALPAKNVAEFVALMKKEGGKHNFGSAGNGNVTQLAMESFKRAYGFEMTHVPYKGIAPAVTDMLGGAIDAMFAGSTAATPHLPSGKVRVLAISGPSRAKALPNVPTFAEAGFPKVEARFYLGLSAPKGTPEAIAQKVAADVKRTMTDKAFLEKYVEFNGFDPVGSSPSEFTAYLRTERKISAERIKAANVTLD